MEEQTMMTKEQRNELNKIRQAMANMDDAYVSSHWGEYLELLELESEEYRESNQAEFDKFYKENIQGKSWNEIDPEDWQFYSDWHKDMYGYRPRAI